MKQARIFCSDEYFYESVYSLLDRVMQVSNEISSTPNVIIYPLVKQGWRY